MITDCFCLINTNIGSDECTDPKHQYFASGSDSLQNRLLQLLNLYNSNKKIYLSSYHYSKYIDFLGGRGADDIVT